MALSAADAPRRSFGSWLLPLLSLGLFLAAAWAIHRELAAWRFADVAAAVEGLPTLQLALAAGAAALSYALLALYDPLALRYLGRLLPARRGALAAFVGYAFSHTMGLPLLTGGAVRYRLYTAWGLPAGDIAGIVAFNSVTLWVGVLAMLALGGLAAPGEIGPLLGLSPSFATAVAACACVLLAAYVGAGVALRRPLTVRSWQFAWPRPPLAATQVLLAVLDWTLAAATLWVLLPNVGMGFLAFASLYTIANVAGVVSHVPAGLGVFEAVLLLALPEGAHAPGVAAALVAYRLIYYVLPLVIAALVFAVHQAHAARGALAERLGLVRASARLVLPNLLAVLVFIGGTVLLVSGATPTVAARLDLLGPLAPLAVIELSHFFSSLVGLALLLLALGLQRRLDAAWWVTVCALAAGTVFSLLKGLDWEEALYLALVLAALLPSHGAFYRRSHLLAQRFSPGWLLAVAAVVVGTAWVGFFCYRHVDYANELWWQFVLEGDAPRFLRATVGVAVLAILFGGLQLIRFARRPGPGEPDKAGIDRAVAALATAETPPSSAWLAVLGDKRFLFSDSGRTFVMYGVQGRSWVAMGEPVGLASERLELLWRYRELCDRWGGRTVFYEIGPELMPDLTELGLTFFKLGEQGFVPLAGFGLEGSARAGLRQAWRRAQRDGATFEVAPAGQLDAHLTELKAISDAWLASKGATEKGFSLGRFDPAYLRRFPFALVRKGPELVAFANLWATPDRRELSIDLMRYREGSLRDVMDYLFVELMLWGKAQGYRRFDLGMAPLSGLQQRQLAPLWTRAGALLFEHGERFYGFEGLRRYKQKFRPVWEPRYLAAPGGLSLPAVLADVALLVGGGAAGLVRKQGAAPARAHREAEPAAAGP
ncbi:MAG TPA: bifunctional lysylphosphatidylglycerol flippase/synthetase MprF [Geminicoccaceae bacterium]|nr:bifunctional lysylphosphatidylglycerol flippase/synthetase MprF [Geminicoccaceae bacterium]